MRVKSHYLLLFIILSVLASCASKKRVVDTRKPAYKREQPVSKREVRKPRPSVSRYEKKTDSRVNQIINEARAYRGTPYRWGGTTRAGMDCSGLLVTSFQAADISLPRTTSQQVHVGRGVSLYELQPGDLVFFAAAKRNSRKITHVGMVTEVRGKHDVRFIHASTKLGVTENNIYTDYYRKIFVKARRPF